MNKYIIALMIFLLAVILIFITIIVTFEDPVYLSEAEVQSELNI